MNNKVAFISMLGLIAASVGVLINYYRGFLDRGIVNNAFSLVLLVFTSAVIVLLTIRSKFWRRKNAELQLSNVDGVEIYKPNIIPFGTQAWNAAISLILIIYGTYGILADDIYIPGKRSRGIHFKGISAWLVYLSFIFATCNLISVIVDHYDKRNNENYYKLIGIIFAVLGWSLFIMAFLIKILGSYISS